MTDTPYLEFNYDPHRGGFFFRVSAPGDDREETASAGGGLFTIDHTDGKVKTISSFWGNGGLPIFGLTNRHGDVRHHPITNVPLEGGVAIFDTIRLGLTNHHLTLAFTPDDQVGDCETVAVGDAVVRYWLSREKTLGGRPVPNEPSGERVPCRQLTRIEVPAACLSFPSPPLRLVVEQADHHN